MATKPILKRTRYKSRLEDGVADQLEDNDVSFGYEDLVLHYTVPARRARYTPDFNLGSIIIEAKGRFRTTAERQKMILVKEQHPDLDIRIVFQDANLPIYKRSKTTYAQWATDHGFQYADKGKIPQSWLEQARKSPPSLSARSLASSRKPVKSSTTSKSSILSPRLKQSRSTPSTVLRRRSTTSVKRASR